MSTYLHFAPLKFKYRQMDRPRLPALFSHKRKARWRVGPLSSKPWPRTGLAPHWTRGVPMVAMVYRPCCDLVERPGAECANVMRYDAMNAEKKTTCVWVAMGCRFDCT